jgi:PAS domain S-box-containing protein
LPAPAPPPSEQRQKRGGSGGDEGEDNDDTAALEMRMLEALTASARDVFLACAVEGGAARYLYISPSVTRSLGWQPAALLGRSAYEFLHPDDVERMGAGLAAVLDGRVPCAHMMHRFLHADCSYRWFHAQACRHDDMLLAVSRDVTEFKNAEAALKEYLLATSHDLRTPVHGVVTAAALLAARPGVAADAEAAFLVQAVQSSCSLMLGLIQNTLEMRNISGATTADAAGAEDSAAAGSAAMMPPPPPPSWLALKPAPVALRGLLADVLRTVRVGCGLLRGKLAWTNEAEADADGDAGDSALPAAVLADGGRVTQVLQSVLLYALRHSPGDAPVLLTVRCERTP